MFIVGGNQSSGGFGVDNSCIFESGAKIVNTFGSTTNRRTFTVSIWIKKCSTTTEQNFVFAGDLSGSNPYFDARFDSNQIINWYCSNGGGSEEFNLKTNRRLLDPFAWYHIVLAVDTTQGTDTNRLKLYINGVQETSFSKSNYPSQNFDTPFNVQNYESSYGNIRNNTPNYDGYYSEIVLIDGQQLDPTSFGEFDSDSGIWKPIDVSGLTFGNNGYYLDFEDSSDLGQDVSGNDNDFTLTNIAAIDQVTDTCTNNYPTYNTLQPVSTTGSVSYFIGNLKASTPSSGGHAPMSSFAVPKSGKWYWEVKIDSVSGNISDNLRIGMQVFDIDNFTNPTLGDIRYISNATKNVDGSNSSYGATYGSGDIIGVAVDSDGNSVEFFKNGSSQGSISYTQNSSDYFAVTSEASGSVAATYLFNFGNPIFSISSGNSDANGYGNFEYSVPSGYYALNTKNLAEYG